MAQKGDFAVAWSFAIASIASGELNMLESLNLKILLILTIGLSFAALLGYLSHKIKLSPIFGYLLAGYLIGPYSPGFVADLDTAEQLSEIGIVLMLFGAGMHFKWQDLIRVRRIAVPGAIIQVLVATVFITMIFHKMGWAKESGIIIGLSIGVASTMVLIRVLHDNHALRTAEGHIAVGWLIVEDIITIFMLLLIPVLAASLVGEQISYKELTFSILGALFKFLLMAVLLLTLGFRLVTFILKKIKVIKYPELFTLTTLAIMFAISIGSASLFGTSIALGAFIAGMVIAQTKDRHLVSAQIAPLKDAFVVVFFLSVGMLFNPLGLSVDISITLLILATILIIKPITAFLLCLILKHPIKTALTVAVGLAQIGEFSFILAKEAISYRLLPDEIYSMIVACALISISINPIFFKLTRQYRPRKH